MEILLLDEQVDLPEHLADVHRKGYGALAEHQQDVSDGRVQAWSWQQAVINPLVPELFGRARKNLIFYRGIVHYRFIF